MTDSADDSEKSSDDFLLDKIDQLKQVLRKRDAQLKRAERAAARKRKWDFRRPPGRPDAH